MEERYKNLIKDIIENILHTSNENNFLSTLINTILKYFDASFIVKAEKNKLIPIAYGDNSKENLECITRIDFDLTNPLIKKTPIAQAVLKNQIILNPNTLENYNLEAIKNEMLKRNYLSSIAIPLITKNFKGAICICKKEKNFFNKIYNICYSLKAIIECIISKINDDIYLYLHQKALDYADILYLITDLNGNIEYVNKKVEQLTSMSFEELKGKSAPQLFGKEYSSSFKKSIINALKNNITLKLILTYNINNKKRYIQTQLIPIEYRGEKKIIALGFDITEEKNLKKFLDKLQKLDRLTNLYNKNYFIKQVYKKLPQCNIGYFILIDIWKLNFINETYGIKIGDKLLQYLSKFLKQIFKTNLISRIEGDTFGIFICDISHNEFLFLIEKLKEKLKSFIKIENLEIKVHINIGISVYPIHSSHPHSLLSKAQEALKISQKKGTDNVTFYHDFHSKNYKEYLNSLELIERAIKYKAFYLFLQPYVNNQNLIKGAESLMRIKLDNTIYTPKDFIDVLEYSTHFMNEVTLLLIEKLEKILLNSKTPISFNLNAKNFEDNYILNKILALSKEFKNKLIIEITESTAIDNFDIVNDFLNKLKKHNTLIALDDFGTGYSSLKYVDILPIDILKIDISFVKEIEYSKKDKDIVNTIISLAKALNIKTVAEGVENKNQFEILKSMNNDYFQGFYFYKPMSEEEFFSIKGG